MRASVICIQKSIKNKRKFEVETPEGGKLKRIASDRKESNHKEDLGTEAKSHSEKDSHHTIQNTPHFRDQNALQITKNFIKVICDSVKKSCKFILEPSILRKSKLAEDSLQNKENFPVSITNSSKISKSTETNTYSHHFQMPLKLPLNENFCLLKSIEKETFNGKKLSSSGLERYLKLKKGQLRRSETSQLPSFAVCSPSDIYIFLCKIEEDPMIALFLKRDVCRRYADKYLLAMVIIYFTRAEISPLNFSRELFFAALYLAHDMEEDWEELKYEVFPYCLGTSWRKYYTYVLLLRDDIFWSINCRAIVSRKCCEQVMKLIPDHWIWSRERPEYHGGIIRNNGQDGDFEPRGPYRTPLWCRTCLTRECGDSENSYLIYSSPSETSMDSQEEAESEDDKKDSGFESFLLGPNEKGKTQREEEGGEQKEEDKLK